ncbi:hypothetical protein DFJ74DRAFT_41989 [Hyaloraphidium curvatum]|nr:hypothetical protein DFJ74DRAFT_41989 [Hyaloraphidium curvatum]
MECPPPALVLVPASSAEGAPFSDGAPHPLREAGSKKSLLHLLSTCRTLLMEGVGLLVRELRIRDELDLWPPVPKTFVSSERHFAIAAELDRWRGLLEEGLGSRKLRRVKSLSVTVASPDPFYASLLRGVGPSVEKLEVVERDPEGVRFFLDGLSEAAMLRSVRLVMNGGVFRRHLLLFKSDAVHWLPLLRHLDQLTTLDRLELEDVDFGAHFNRPRNWVQTIGTFPQVAASLRCIALMNYDLDKWPRSKARWRTWITSQWSSTILRALRWYDASGALSPVSGS